MCLRIFITYSPQLHLIHVLCISSVGCNAIFDSFVVRSNDSASVDICVYINADDNI
jgi:hypothetical protein